ncbi:hypothetical protein R1sor_009493 [Riccia sorocarpa]|uniref:Alpha-1,6-mannosyl-glycoprotein 2-beta-N-acetylglucosaminyltransferase n=1 Tax=Riccia sorocarpa TaxID=122646 RepID=A0ABD3HV86_9MARC
MDKSGLNRSGCSRRQLLLLLLFQLIGLSTIYTTLQYLTVDVSIWSLPRSIPQEWELSEEDSTRGEIRSLADDEPKRDRYKIDGSLVLPYQNDLTRRLELKNREPPRNRDLFPELAEDHIPIVLYVHNRPQYFQVVVDSLAKVKQIFALFSPHLFNDTFPGEAPEDCKGAEDPSATGCVGNPDQYGNHRSRRIVSLKHHWWWMMNTVWDGLAETWNRDGNILFIEEDHFILPNAYRSIKMLRDMKNRKCPECAAVSLAPVDVASKGEGREILVIEKVGNIGYCFNRTVFNWIRSRAKSFCSFDDYNWDITMWATVYPSFPNGAGYTLRGSKPSARHFGKCGLHQGQEEGKPPCIDDNERNLPVGDVEPFLSEDWRVVKFPIRGYNQGFEGWGGWGDKRDHQLCLDFSRMYRT